MMSGHMDAIWWLSRLQKVDLVSLLFFFLPFIFFSILLSIFLFLELRVRVRIETSPSHISHSDKDGHKS